VILVLFFIAKRSLSRFSSVMIRAVIAADVFAFFVRSGAHLQRRRPEMSLKPARNVPKKPEMS
jgi:hypothetical protein